MEQQQVNSFVVVWRGQKIILEMNSSATFKDFGEKLQELTNVKADTLRLLVPIDNTSKMVHPFTKEHSSLRLDSISLLKGKSIIMMGVPEDEVDELLRNAKVDLRIAGFDEEEKRLKQRSGHGSYSLQRLPQGNYIFCDFRTLSLPGIELNPPASKALELLHKLASDPGIVAIMNKHRWRVGILTEMAPVGYVGISPKCILGFNQNHGEEISLRLRTDDLKGFRKYESIKKILLHELAHMVYSEHDSNFYALDSQLNKEAASLDWTKSRGHSLSRTTHSWHHEEDFDVSSNVISSHKLGGQALVAPNARAASVNAAFERLANTLSRSSPKEKTTPVSDPIVDSDLNAPEPDPDERENKKYELPGPFVHSGIDSTEPNNINVQIQESGLNNSEEDPNCLEDNGSLEPRLNGCHTEDMQTEINPGQSILKSQTSEPDLDDPELQIIQDPVTTVYDRLQRAIQSLKCEVIPPDTERVLQTLFKIICNVIEHPDDVKYRKLRKANPTIQRNIITYKAAVDILTLIGFCEGIVTDERGKAEAYLMLKRNDPGLLWLAKSSLETCIS
ncbi:Unknown protein [Striga hermonthica]|uniref:WLM domain-containing protein n=1 Tax=Striga hermonthica TaxID=68872 RepID=A0A9N7NQU7_STRHE|nr:Unknown protein [Striga hermonthica]